MCAYVYVFEGSCASVTQEPETKTGCPPQWFFIWCLEAGSLSEPELANSAGFPLSKISLCLPPTLGVQTQALTRVQEAISNISNFEILIFQSAYHPRFPEK